MKIQSLVKLLDVDLFLNTPWHAVSMSMEHIESPIAEPGTDSNLLFEFNADVQFVLPRTAPELVTALDALLSTEQTFHWLAPISTAQPVLEIFAAAQNWSVLSVADKYDFALRPVREIIVHNTGSSTAMQRLATIASETKHGAYYQMRCSSAPTGLSMATRLYDSRAREMRLDVTIRNLSPCHASGIVQFPMMAFFRPLVHTAMVDESTFLLDVEGAYVMPHSQLLAGTMGAPFVLAPGGSSVLSVRANKALLHFQSYPPDASRGFDIPPVIFQYRAICPDGQSLAAHAFGDGILTVLPIPDASMPFNVITLVSTMMAFVIGSMINAMVRRARKKNTTTKSSLLQRLKAWMQKK